MGKGKKSRKDKLTVPHAPMPEGKQTGDPSVLLPGSDTSDQRICWRFAHVDHESRWGFDRMESEVLCEVLRKLSDCESMTVNELRTSRRLFKEYDLPSGLCKEALARLTAVRRDDLTKIHRLQFTGTQRLYGFLERNIFHVVWWDPDHDVYPTSPRNT